MSNTTKQPFLAFASDGKDIETLKAFATAQQWPDTSVFQGDIRTASEYLKTNPSPALLVVEVTSAEEAPAQLDGLAEVCDPDTKVIVTGTVNEFSFYRWLTEIGIFSYQLRPLTASALEADYAKSNTKPAAPASSKPEKPPAKIIAVMGARGGVGATTLSINLAAVIADLSKKDVALIDIDPQEGSIALTLDIEPGRGFRDALEKPDRIDSLFIERVMTKQTKHLSILSAEEAFQEKVIIHEQAAELLLKEMKQKFDILVIDIPRHLRTFSRKCLMQADQVVLVTEFSLLALRDTLRLSDMMRDALKMKPPVVVANRVGLSKFDMKQSDFEKGIDAKVVAAVPFAPNIFIPPSTEIPVLKFRDMAPVKPVFKLAELLVPEAKTLLSSVKEKKGFGMFGAKKKPEDAPADKEQEA